MGRAPQAVRSLRSAREGNVWPRVPLLREMTGKRRVGATSEYELSPSPRLTSPLGRPGAGAG